MRWWTGLLFAIPLSAHLVSFSESELSLEGNRAEFRLSIPLYELEHLRQARETLLDRFQFPGATLTASGCRAEGDQWECRATIDFPTEPESVKVQCDLASVLVAGHVHVMRLRRAGVERSAVFDATYRDAVISLFAPAPVDRWTRDAAAGAGRAVAGWSRWLWLAVLAFAIRRDWRLIGAAAAGAALGLFAGRPVLPGLLEAGAAAVAAYVAFEAGFFAEGAWRWVGIAALGVASGLDLQWLQARTDANGVVLLIGWLLVACCIAAAVAYPSARLPDRARRGVCLALIAVALTWFVRTLF
jgi:hypothetical protein